MGQKIHPTGFRLAVTRGWASRWYAPSTQYAKMLSEDIMVREYLAKRLKNASVSRVLIERPAKNARITIYSARPGVVIGKKGEDIENLKAELAKRLGVPVAVDIEEVRKPEIDAQLIADSITQQLEKRIQFRTSEAKTTYGVIGVKVWVYKGDTPAKGAIVPAKAEPAAPEEDRRNRRPGAARPSGARRAAPAADGEKSVAVKRVRKPAQSGGTSGGASGGATGA